MIIDKIYLIYKKIHLNLLSPFILILLLINESLESLLLILLSILIHEFGHFIAIKLFSVKIERIKIDPWGISILINKYTSYRNEIAVAFFGPLFGVLIATISYFLHNYLPSITIFYFMILNLSYSIINLIPCEFLDGGLIIKSLLYLLFPPETAYKIAELIYRINSAIIIILMAISCYCAKFNISLTSLFIFIFILFPHKNKNQYI